MKININSEKKKTKLALALELFTVFLKISPITFGGGFAMVPIIEREVVERKKWINNEQMADTLVAAQSVPGAVAVNSAILIGYNINGVVGALAALLGTTIPTFIIIVAMGLIYTNIRELPMIQSAMKGIQAAVIGLVIIAARKMCSASLRDKITWGIFIISTAVLVLCQQINIVFIILAGAGTGILVTLLKLKSNKLKQK